MLELFKQRRACRKFDSEREVEKEKIEEILQAGLLAPSGMNRQTPVFIVFNEKESRDKLAVINRTIGGRLEGDPFYGAPVVIMVIAKRDGLSVHDGAASIENMLLEATNQGLGTCWVHRAKEELENEEARELLKPLGLNLDEYVGIGHIALGYSLMDKYPEKVSRDGRVLWMK